MIYSATGGGRTFSKVMDKKKCSSSNKLVKGYVSSANACANKCNGDSSMFTYATREFGSAAECSSNGCKCVCEKGATDGGTCSYSDDNNYKLYKYIGSTIFQTYFVLLLDIPQYANIALLLLRSSTRSTINKNVICERICKISKFIRFWS